MAEHPEVAAAIVARLSAICLGLPEAWQERAWTGTRWMVGKKNFAHVVAIAEGWPPAYAQAAGHPGPLTVLTFGVVVVREIRQRALMGSRSIDTGGQ